LRHFFGTMEYHRTKEILHVMQALGHKTSRTRSCTSNLPRNSSKTSRNTSQK
jgi:hypothetical protein